MSPRQPVTWILVADGSKAKIFAHNQIGGGLELVDTQDYGTARSATRDLVSDRPGRTFSRVGGSRHAKEPKTDAHNHEKQAFAAAIASHLESAANQNKFERLVLIAPPKALGDLRGALCTGSRKKVIGEIQKDLTYTLPTDLPRYLGEVMAV